jgi:signal transduction histidine kinase
MPSTKQSAAPRDSLVFKVKPRLLTLLGDQLIRDANLAVFELVKNAYDADATTCSVVLDKLGEADARIVVTDDGTGMNEATLRNVWMVIATDFRAHQREQNTRTAKFHRYPLGEKGLGRLSIHKLGRTIRLVTRVRRGDELVLRFDWDRIEAAEELDQASVTLERRQPKAFPGNQHGTRFVITHLRESWTRKELRSLHRAVNSLCSPFKGPADFNVTLTASGHEDWLRDLFTSEEASQCALYHVRGSFRGKTAAFDYTFTPPPGYSKVLRKREATVSGAALERKEGRTSVPIDLSQHSIGSVAFDFLLFDRDPSVLHEVTDDTQGLKRFLDENGGIRIYRDGMRVYDFGEPGNDWLNLDIRRVNTPTARTSNNQILGVLRLDATASSDLREKTNREGFIESSAFSDFRDAVISLLTQVEAEKSKDQKRVREVLGRGTGKKVFDKLSELREILDDKGILEEVEPTLKAAEKELEIYRDQLLHAAVPGLTIGIMLHGVEKIVDELRAATAKAPDPVRVKELVDRLYRAMRPVSNMLKNPGRTKTSAAALIKDAIFSAEIRLRRHHIELINGIEGGTRDFPIQGSRQMLVASLTNLIDNSIHWLETKQPAKKLLYIGTSHDLEGGPAIVVADNGPGFGKDEPEDLVTPFFTRRTGGMGLGLYVVSEVMRVNRGRLLFPNHKDIDLPRTCDAAVVALQFLETE